MNETVRKPDNTNEKKIVRSSRIQDTEDGLSEFYAILNQARVHDFFLEKTKNASEELYHYNLKLINLTSDFLAKSIDENKFVNCIFEKSMTV